MNDNEHLELIRRKIQTGGGLLDSGEVAALLRLIDTLEKKNALLSRHVLELTEELENVKMDFGGGSR